MKILSVIIPCCNEAVTIRPLIEKVSRISLPERWDMEVVIIDDGSKDGTREILEEYRDKFKIFFHSENSGKGTAVKTGLKMHREIILLSKTPIWNITLPKYLY